MSAEGDALKTMKTKLKKLKRKTDNEKVILEEEEVKHQMEIDSSGGTELGAPI
jgi:hypothetical protein